MASTKLSALPSASVVNAGDYLLVTQGGASVKLDIQTLVKNLPVRPIVLEASEEQLLAAALSTAILTSKIAAPDAGVAYTLAAGTHGMEKEIVCSSADVTTPSGVVTVTGGIGFTTITFAAVGNSVKLKNIDGSWYVVGSNGVALA